MRVSGLRPMFIAAVIFGIFAALPQTLHAASDSYAQLPGEFSPTAGTPFQDAGGPAPSLIWESVSVAEGSTFTGSLLDTHSGPIDESAINQDPSKSSNAEKGPGAKVPEPGTLLLMCAGLLGLARVSGRKIIRH